MNLEKHISDLLYRNDCVVVPNFGAFIGDWKSAVVDEVQQNFEPPKKLISFNPKIKNNDGLLANHVAVEEIISYVDAVTKIHQIVLSWLEKLNNKETLQLEKIGSFSLNADQNIVFLPNNQINYLADSFGLSSFTSKAISRQKEIEIEQAQIRQIEVVEPQNESKVVRINKVNKIKKKNNNAIKYAAAIALFSTVGTTSYKLYNDYQVDQQTLAIQQRVQKKIQEQIQQATFVLPNPISSIDLTEKLEQDTIQQLNKIAEESTVPQAETISKKAEVKKPEIKNAQGERLPYHVIGAAFQSKANAEKSAREFIRRGFSGASVLPKNASGLYPVVYGSFKTREEADSLIQKIKTVENAEVWLHF